MLTTNGCCFHVHIQHQYLESLTRKRKVSNVLRIPYANYVYNVDLKNMLKILCWCLEFEKINVTPLMTLKWNIVL